MTLKRLNLKSSGIYRCEISAEAPNFSSAEGLYNFFILEKSWRYYINHFIPFDYLLITIWNCVQLKAAWRSYVSQIFIHILHFTNKKRTRNIRKIVTDVKSNQMKNHPTNGACYFCSSRSQMSIPLVNGMLKLFHVLDVWTQPMWRLLIFRDRY